MSEGSARETHKPIALLDMDGVLVDNVSFDGAVTKFIVSALAEQRALTLASAKRAWERELAESRTDCRWYDYDFHCQRLGLANLASEAHAVLADRLRLVPGAGLTVDLLRRSHIEVVVATDAVPAVAEFKLRHLGLNADRVVSSQLLGATKASSAYWARLREELGDRPVLVLIENRLDNILAARSELGRSTLYVRFAFHEHVTRLPARVTASEWSLDASNDILTVRTHATLRRGLERELS